MTAFPPGGNSLSEYGHHLVSHLARDPGVERVTVFADEVAQGRGEERTTAGLPPGTDVVPSWAFNDPRSLWRVVRAVRQARPDAVLLNLQFATFGDRKVPGGLGLLLPAALRLAGVPSFVVLHNLADAVDLRKAGFARSALAVALLRLAGRALTRAVLQACLVAVTIPRYVELLRTEYRARNVWLAPHGSFEPPPDPGVGVPDGPLRILAFGKWGTYKTVDVLVEAYEKLLAEGRGDLELVVAGTDSPNAQGYLAGVAERARHLPGVRFTGYVAEDDVAGLFRSAAVVAFPYTSTTGSSGVLHQAGEQGRAAVLPRIDDFVDVIEEEGFRGVYFEPEDAASLAAALAEVLDDAEGREQLGRANYLAAAGLPMAEVVQWHVLHMARVVQARRGRPWWRPGRPAVGR